MKMLFRWMRDCQCNPRAPLLCLLLLATGITASAQSCAPLPNDAVAWWRADNDAQDSVGAAPGSLVGNESYAPGEVGSGFSGAGAGCGVLVSNTTALQLQTLTIEGWLQRGDAGSVSSGSGGSAGLVGFGPGGYFFWMTPDGTLQFNKLGDNAYSSGAAVHDRKFHHVAVTIGLGQLQFYVDGVNAGATPYNPAFTFAGPLGIGCRPDNDDNCFNGVLDEIGIYDRILGAAEIQAIYNAGSAGKCVQLAPVFIQEPYFYFVTLFSCKAHPRGIILFCCLWLGKNADTKLEKT